MKRKMILPLLAVVFAIAAAFGTLPFQSAWYKPSIGAVTTGNISTPAPSSGITCGASGSSVCLVGTKDAYMNESDAVAQNHTNLFRYTPAP